MIRLTMALLLTLTACSDPLPAADQPGRILGQVVFCEGDAVRIDAGGGRLSVSCADQRKTPISVSGKGALISGVDIDCSAWGCTGMVLVGEDHTIRHSSFSTNGTSMAIVGKAQ